MKQNQRFNTIHALTIIIQIVLNRKYSFLMKQSKKCISENSKKDKMINEKLLALKSSLDLLVPFGFVGCGGTV